MKNREKRSWRVFLFFFIIKHKGVFVSLFLVKEQWGSNNYIPETSNMSGRHEPGGKKLRNRDPNRTFFSGSVEYFSHTLYLIIHCHILLFATLPIYYLYWFIFPWCHNERTNYKINLIIFIKSSFNHFQNI